MQTALGWLGQRWADTVTIESQPKVEALMDAGFNGGETRWRQVNHPIGDETDLPILYKAMPSEGESHIVVVGRNLRPMSQMQQQLLDVQHRWNATTRACTRPRCAIACCSTCPARRS